MDKVFPDSVCRAKETVWTRGSGLALLSNLPHGLFFWRLPPFQLLLPPSLFPQPCSIGPFSPSYSVFRILCPTYLSVYPRLRLHPSHRRHIPPLVYPASSALSVRIHSGA